MSHINESDLQFPDTGNDGAHDEHPDDLTSFDSSTLMFPSVGDADEPRQTPPAQPPQPPAKQRRKAKSAVVTPDEPAAQTGRTAQPTQTGHTEAGDVTNMTGAVRIRPSDVHHNMTHTPDYLHALGHFRTVFRPVAASPCADWRSLDYSQSTSHAFTLSTYPHFPRNSWSPPHVLPSMCGMRIRAHTQRPTGKGERRERNIRP